VAFVLNKAIDKYISILKAEEDGNSLAISVSIGFKWQSLSMFISHEPKILRDTEPLSVGILGL